MQDIPILSIVGTSGSGKTTFLERLIPELKRRGYRIALIKHHPQPGLETDVPGKDTWRVARAGADQVILATPEETVHRRRWQRAPGLEDIVAEIRGVDLILTEGYKREHTPKIEVNRRAHHPALISPLTELVAVVSDQRFDVDVPQFSLNDAEGVAEWIDGKLKDLGGLAVHH
jgi:molybdopterin-guanine dinucleotide biosynthesis protein MobB